MAVSPAVNGWLERVVLAENYIDLHVVGAEGGGEREWWDDVDDEAPFFVREGGVAQDEAEKGHEHLCYAVADPVGAEGEGDETCYGEGVHEEAGERVGEVVMPWLDAPLTALSLQRVEVECGEFGPGETPLREDGGGEGGGGRGALPEEGVDFEGEAEPDEAAEEPGGDDVAEETDLAVEEEVGDLGEEEEGDFGAEEDGGEG